LQVGFSMRLFKCRQNLQKFQLSIEFHKNISLLSAIVESLHFCISSKHLMVYRYIKYLSVFLNIFKQQLLARQLYSYRYYYIYLLFYFLSILQAHLLLELFFNIFLLIVKLLIYDLCLISLIISHRPCSFCLIFNFKINSSSLLLAFIVIILFSGSSIFFDY
jgi:hypothetical protein